jgi:acyl-CoA thioesterase FadM
MVSRWPVLVSLPVAASDCDEDGRLTDAAVERFFAQARAAYFERCATVDGSTLELRGSTVQRGTAAAGDDGVTVSVNVVEVFPDSFTMTAMFRPRDGDGIAATAWCSLSPGGEVSTAMRDEFIALAHTATSIH